MEEWLLIDDQDNKIIILDRCLTYSKTAAEYTFIQKGWVIGETLSTADYLLEQQQNAYEAENM